ncbi:Uncharacterized membrane protein [Alteromonadaceae bacterium Bs31]|nr:Uncharacterized membrane protein [Alteromonadaceae bacterium Bs31]
MTLIIIGLGLWCFAHLIPSLFIPLKKTLIAKAGENAYAGLVATLIVSGIVLIVLGWRGSTPVHLYVPPYGLRHATYSLMLLSFFLFASANYNSRLKSLLRHPMLLGLLSWSVAHLLSNGETRSIVLFGTLAAWALIEIVLINRRDKDWQKPEVVPLKKEIKALLGSVFFLAIMIFLHKYYTGMPLVVW